MFGPQVPDKVINQQVTRRLLNRGIRSPCRVDVETRNGDVRLSGSVEHAHQKQAAIAAISGISGVRRVVNELIVKPPVKRS